MAGASTSSPFRIWVLVMDRLAVNRFTAFHSILPLPIRFDKPENGR